VHRDSKQHREGRDKLITSLFPPTSYTLRQISQTGQSGSLQVRLYPASILAIDLWENPHTKTPRILNSYHHPSLQTCQQKWLTSTRVTQGTAIPNKGSRGLGFLKMAE